MKIALSGSSGLIGSSLFDYLVKKKHEVFRLVRTPDKVGMAAIYWNPREQEIELKRLENLDAVIHLAGENIFGRWTEERKKRILESRVIGTRLLSQSLASLEHPPKVAVMASGINYYGDRGDEILDENSSTGEGFLAEVCRQWEAASQPAKDRGIRTINLRLGVVLTEKGGAFPLMVKPFRFGLGGRLGDGSQYMSWVMLEDLLEVFDFILNHDTLSGPVNATTPEPVTNAYLTKALSEAIDRPAIFRVPGFGLRLITGEMANEMLLASIRVIPKKLTEAGFVFKFPRIRQAFEQLLQT